MFIVACLHEGFPYVEVLSFDHTISLGIIWGNLDMMNPIFLARYPAAATNAGPLSVTISAMPCHWQRISSNMKLPSVFFQSGHHFAHDESVQHAWMRYLNLFTVGMSIVSMWTLWKSVGILGIVGGK